MTCVYKSLFTMFLVAKKKNKQNKTIMCQKERKRNSQSSLIFSKKKFKAYAFIKLIISSIELKMMIFGKEEIQCNFF